MDLYYSGGLDTLLIIIGFLISLIATIRVKLSYSKYKKIKNKRGLTGFDVARKILDDNGLKDVLVLETQGSLTDYYDPKRKVVKLSSDVYHNDSIASIAVASHECGHAIQDKENYKFLRFRASIFPLVRISSNLGYFALMIGLIFGLTDLIWIGIALELIILLFQLVTLPVEFNASSRALNIISKNGLILNDEYQGAKRMLVSAAMTYVASVLTSIMEIFRLILIARDNDR